MFVDLADFFLNHLSSSGHTRDAGNTDGWVEVFVVDKIETRYRIEKPKDLDGFISLISDKLSFGVDGIDSGSFNFLECDYLDVYLKYPM